jgi:hypothetical protein
MSTVKAPVLDLDQANRLAALPLKCLQQEYPNKLGQTLRDSASLATPRTLHPAFYGCFDWHSSVHGHWMLVKLLKMFPEQEQAEEAREKLGANISRENILGELDYFRRSEESSYERTYGWAWLLKLAEELHTWDDPLGVELSENLRPLADLLVERYLEFLPKLNYPIRVGEHTNTAFGLSLAWDYAATIGHQQLQDLIRQRAISFYQEDQNCPVDWEPSGYDFLSPCLEEIDIMRRVLDQETFRIWLKKFIPDLSKPDFYLAPGVVSDRSDGKLVHLDGLNFSRAWCLYGLSETLPDYDHLRNLAHQHVNYSLPSMVDGGYEGEHWLASFALYARSIQSKLQIDKR